MDRAIDEQALIVFEHDPEVTAGFVELRDGKYRLSRRVSWGEAIG